MRRRLLAALLLWLAAVPVAGLLRFGRADAALDSCTMACSGTERCCCTKAAAPARAGEAIPEVAAAFEARFERAAPGCPCAIPDSRTEALAGAARILVTTGDSGSMRWLVVQEAPAPRDVSSTCPPRAPPVSSAA